MSKKICVLYGDGIGPLVVDEAVRVISSLRQDISFKYARIGFIINITLILGLFLMWTFTISPFNVSF